MKRIVLFAGLVILLAVSCNRQPMVWSVFSDIDSGESKPAEVAINIQKGVDVPTDLKSCTLLTMQGEFPILDNTPSVVGTFRSRVPQLVMLIAENGDVLMMIRGAFEENKTYVLNAETSALAMVTLHPLFAPVPADAYGALETFIKSSAFYQPFLNEVTKAVSRGKSLYDTGNTELMSAFSTLMDDLCSGADDEVNDGSEPFTKASGGMTNIIGINAGPFKVILNHLVLGVSNYALTPYYDGTVLFPNMSQQVEMDIPANDEYGITSFVTGKDLEYGNPVTFNFSGSPEGDYVFEFDRTTEQARMEYACKLIANILDALGLPFDKFASESLAKEIWAYLILDVGGSAISPDRYSPMEWVETVAVGVVGFLGSDDFHAWAAANLSEGVAGKLVGKAICQKLVMIYNVYTLLRGGVNAAMSVYYSWNQPKFVYFILNHSNNVVRAARDITLTKVSGDNQSGFGGQRLLLPLRVKVSGTYKSTHTSVEPQVLCKLRFSIVSGGGSLNAQEVYLDEEGIGEVYLTLSRPAQQDNVVRAVAIDLATGEETSDAVEFHATADDSDVEGSVTVRLDWNKTASDTDIDLHIIDPKGHHICYSSMTCACGGYLDRDDRQGPGPEHIIYTNAPAGIYQVMVHHYPNGKTEGKIVGFSVTAHVGERRYAGQGSVSYDQMVTLGTFEVGAPTRASEEGFVPGSLYQWPDPATLPRKQPSPLLD